MLLFNGVEAAIAIDGVELPRYRVQRDSLNDTVTCWIPSEAGKAFSILWSSGPSHHSKDVTARVWIDGISSDGLFQGSCDCRDPSHTHSMDRVTVSTTTAHRMIFSAVNHTAIDYKNDNGPDDSYKDLGQIVVTINEAEAIRLIPCYPLGYAKSEKNGQPKKKLLSHEIRLEKEKPVSPPSQSWCVSKDIRLLAKFIFKYQPLDLLIADGIAPASLYKRKAENEDPEADDQARWETIQNSIALLEKKLVKQGRASFNTIVDNNLINDDNSDLEYDEARLFSLRNAANVLHKALLQKGQAPAKKMKLAHDSQAGN